MAGRRSRPVSGPGTGRDRRPAMVHRGALLTVASRCLPMFSLSGYWRDVSPTSDLFLLPRRARADPTVTAVEADPILGVPVDDGGVVNVVIEGDVHVVHRAVVEKPAVFPASAFIPVAEVSEAVVDTAVETDLRAPVAVIENKSAAASRFLRRYQLRLRILR